MDYVSIILPFIGGLGMFIYGMQIMAQGLENAAGSKMKSLLEVLTKNKFFGVLLGAFITAVIQSSSATTVMVVGFVNAGIMNLTQAMGVIMGANIGTTVAEKYLRLNNLALENAPEDLVITTHVCRGNYHSTWASSGGYEPIAPFLFANENVSAYYLEFDDERSGGFEPLRFVSDHKKVVLGLVTSKSPILEEKEVIKKRIAKAAKYIPLNRLYLSPQCGFASCEIGNKLTEEEQWAKLALVKEIYQEVWV